MKGGHSFAKLSATSPEKTRPGLKLAFSSGPSAASKSRLRCPGQIKLTCLNLLLTISKQHRTAPSGHCARTGSRPRFVRWQLLDLSARWSKRHVGRQCAPSSKSAVRIHFGHCRRFHHRLAYGIRNYLDLLLRTPDFVSAAFVDHPVRSYSVDHST